MTYEKTNWTSTTPINTANLNKIENRIASLNVEKINVNDFFTSLNVEVSNFEAYKIGRLIVINRLFVKGVSLEEKKYFTVGTINTKYQPPQSVRSLGIVSGEYSPTVTVYIEPELVLNSTIATNVDDVYLYNTSYVIEE